MLDGNCDSNDDPREQFTAPLISIITPTFNRATYIERTLLSVLNQSYRNVEYFVMDGGSTDSTAELLSRYVLNDSRIVFRSETDEGMYDAINKGLCVASGDILAYINSDDFYAPDTLSKVVSYFAWNPEVDVVFGDSLVLDSSSGRAHVNIYLPKPERWLTAGGIICQPTVFMRRRCWDEEGGFSKNVKYLGDCEYWLRLIKSGRCFGKIDEVLAVEVNHGDTLRRMVQKEIENEKRYLADVYWPRMPMRGFLRWLTLLHRRLLTPIWYLRLINRIDRKCTNGAWSSFIQNYAPKASLRHYAMNKMFKSNLPVWEVQVSPHNR